MNDAINFIKESKNWNYNLMKKQGEIDLSDAIQLMEDYHQSKVKENELLHSVSGSLPTRDEVIAEGDKQIEDWLSGNHYKEQRAYRVAFRRSYEYVLRFSK